MGATFDWSDLGTWMSLYSLLKKDSKGNVHKGNVISFDSSNNLIISNTKLTSVVGLNNVAIINLDDSTLIIDLFKTPIDLRIAISRVLFLTRIVKPDIMLNAATIIIKDKITVDRNVNFNYVIRNHVYP